MSYSHSNSEEKPALSQPLLIGAAVVGILLVIGILWFQIARSNQAKTETITIPATITSAPGVPGQRPAMRPRQPAPPPPGLKVPPGSQVGVPTAKQ